MTAVGKRPAGGPVVSIAVCRCSSVVGFELEFARLLGTQAPGVSAAGFLNTNVVVQSRTLIRGFQFYGTGGLTLFGEDSDTGGDAGGIANIGGGAKRTLASTSASGRWGKEPHDTHRVVLPRTR